MDIPYARFTVAGTHGYRVLVSSSLGDFEAVHLIASRRHAAVEYLTFDGRADREGIEARFGGVGLVSVRFHPAGPSHSPVRPPRNCEALRARDRVGFFTGRIEFHGERGFTGVDLRRARGHAGVVRVRCPPPGPFTWTAGTGTPDVYAHFDDGEFIVGKEAIRHLRALATPDLVDALQLGRLGTGPVPFAAEHRESRGLTSIRRVAAARGPARSLILDRAARTARIGPPAPFAGVATSRACPREWSGTLTAHFPGRTMRLVRRGNRHQVWVLDPDFLDCRKRRIRATGRRGVTW
jgi:hypothetical protein